MLTVVPSMLENDQAYGKLTEQDRPILCYLCSVASVVSDSATP